MAILNSRKQPCHLVVFSGKLPSVEAEIDCRLQSNSRQILKLPVFAALLTSVTATAKPFEVNVDEVGCHAEAVQ